MPAVCGQAGRRVTMKKMIIAALVMLLVGTTAAFAPYDGSQIVDYAGLSVGASYVNETYDVVLLGGGGREKDTALQLDIALTDYVFVGSAPVGLYMDMGALINLKNKYTVNDQPAGDGGKSPVYADVTLGAAFKTSLGSKLNLFAAVGPEFTYFTRVYDYYDSMHYLHKVEKTFMTLGLAANADLMFDLGGGFYLSAGARASVYFLKWMTNEDKSWWQYESYSSDTENYFGFRGTAKVGAYFAF